MDFEQLKKDVSTNQFISTFIAIFIILFIVISLIKFIGSLPMLLLTSFIMTYYIVKNRKNNKEIKKNES
jgi:hypothetical protein